MKATLKILVIEGRDLIAKDRNGLSNLFVVISLKEQQVKTPIINKSLNPVWKIDFLLTVTEAERNQKIVFEVWDQDYSMGVVTLPIRDLVSPNVTYFDEKSSDAGVPFKLSPRSVKEDAKGDIILKIGFIDNVDPSLVKHLQGADTHIHANLISTDDAVEEPGTDDTQMGVTNINHAESAGLLRIDIVSATHLISSSKSCYPFVTLSFGKKAFRTRVLRHTHEPAWNERAVLQIKHAELQNNWILQCSVYNNSRNDDILGTAKLPIKEILAESQSKGVKRKANEATYFESVDFSLALVNPNANGGQSDNGRLLLRVIFVTFKDIRRNFWINLAKLYDSNGDEFLNHAELTTLFDSLHSTFSADTLKTVFFSSINDEKVSLDDFAERAEKRLKAGVESSGVLDTAVTATNGDQHYGRDNEEIMIQLDNCPICHRRLTNTKSDADTVSHVALCGFEDSNNIDRFLLGGFLTEAYASRKWYTKILQHLECGKYKIGNDNKGAVILVQNRATGQLEEEKMPTLARMGIRLLYQDAISRISIETQNVKALFKRLSILQGNNFNHPKSKKEISNFIKFHNIDTSEILQPLDSFQTFNEFFYRKLKSEARTLASVHSKVAVSSADCRMTAFGNVGDAKRIWIKGKNFSVKNLLGDESLLTQTDFEGGSIVICRLAPQDYHRFHSPVDGTIKAITDNLGDAYFTVNPIAIRSPIDVYTENVRKVVYIDSPDFGLVAMVNVGAMLVGSVEITARINTQIKRMDEVGYYAFGGSTTILFFQTGKISLDEDLLSNSKEELETLVKVGNNIGIACSP